MIEIEANDDEIVAIRLGGEALRSDDGETWFLPKALIVADMLVNELTAAFRVTRDVTLKASYYARKPYGQLTWDQQAAFQAVFQHRWW